MVRPVIVYNAAHPGSRLLTRLLTELGVFMGANLSDSEDSEDMAELVEHIVLEHAPDYTGLFAEGDPALGPAGDGGRDGSTRAAGRSRPDGAGSSAKPATPCRSSPGCSHRADHPPDP